MQKPASPDRQRTAITCVERVKCLRCLIISVVANKSILITLTLLIAGIIIPIEKTLHRHRRWCRRSPPYILQGTISATARSRSTENGSLWISRAAKGLTLVLSALDIDRYNSSLGIHHPSNTKYAVEPKSLSQFLHFPAPHSFQIPNLHHLRHVNTSAHHQDRKQQHHLAAEIRNQTDVISMKYVIPLPIFVASDDPEVLVLAKSLGYLVEPRGVSQNTASVGMLSTLVKHPEYGYNATLEIITDIFFLSQCSSLSGVCGSQVYRMAVALSNVTGSLHFAKAMDTDQINQVRKMSNKYRIPFPETFR